MPNLPERRRQAQQDALDKGHEPVQMGYGSSYNHETGRYTVRDPEGHIIDRGTASSADEVNEIRQGFSGSSSGGGSGSSINNSLSVLERQLQQMSQGYVDEQTATLRQNKQAQLADIEKALADAVADGQISVREANAQFEQAERAIQEQAYQDAERTNLYGQQMGLQNSQQMAGLMASDQARNRDMMNQNMSARDRRINDIQDRLNAIRQQGRTMENQAREQFRTGVQQAEAQAQQQLAQQTFNLQNEERTAQRDQGFAEQQMRLGDELQRGQMGLQDELQRGQMGLQHGFNMETMQQDFANQLELTNKQNEFALEQMKKGHKLDVQKMGMAFRQDLEKMGIQQQNALDMAERQMEMQTQAEVEAYERNLERATREFTPGTNEYNIARDSAEREFQQGLQQAQIEALVTAEFENQLLQGMQEPERPGAVSSFFSQAFTGRSGWDDYHDRLDEYNLQQESLNRVLDRYMTIPRR